MWMLWRMQLQIFLQVWGRANIGTAVISIDEYSHLQKLSSYLWWMMQMCPWFWVQKIITYGNRCCWERSSIFSYSPYSQYSLTDKCMWLSTNWRNSCRYKFAGWNWKVEQIRRCRSCSDYRRKWYNKETQRSLFIHIKTLIHGSRS